MKRIAGLIIATSMGFVAATALAEERTVTLKLENFTCASCAFIVKRTLTDVPGVAECDVSYREQLARVTFDDEKTSVAALTAATLQAGFPSRPAE
ncbi:MAG: cation transporter [Alphaproteobacteria bacterium]